MEEIPFVFSDLFISFSIVSSKFTHVSING